MRKTEKRTVEPGYRLPRSTAERQFWDLHQPDYRAWATKRKLTLDQVAALAMGLDPESIEWIELQKDQTFSRFKSTKAWFRDVETRFNRFLPDDLLGISVFAMDYHLRVPNGLTEAAALDADGLLDREKEVAKLKQKITKQEATIARQNAVIAKGAVRQGTETKVRRPSDITNAEKNSSKLIVALMAECIGDEKEWRKQFLQFKNGGNTNLVTRALNAIELLGWRMDEETVAARFEKALSDWDPQSKKAQRHSRD
jgi:hypothetical protein